MIVLGGGGSTDPAGLALPLSPGEEEEEGRQGSGQAVPSGSQTPTGVRASPILQHHDTLLREGSPGPQAGGALGLRQGAVGQGLGGSPAALGASNSPGAWGDPWGHRAPAQLAEGSGGLGDSRQVAAPAAGPCGLGFDRAARAGGSRVSPAPPTAQVGMLRVGIQVVAEGR